MRNAATMWRPTACVHVMRPGTCPLHRIRSDGRPRGGSKELRQHGRRRFCQVDWHEMFHSFRHRGARCVARLRPLLPAALLVVDCYSVSASVRVCPLFRGGAPRGWCTWGFLHVHVTPPTLLPACTLVAGPCSPARGVRILASIRCSARRVSAGRDPSPRPSLVCDSFFSALLACEGGVRQFCK